MKLSLAYSPCPNDTFIFDAMVHGKIDTEGLEFEVVHADVEELNRRAFNKELDITKLSYHAYAHLTADYILLRSGSALGNNCGPLLVAARNIDKTEVENLSIAIPGKSPMLRAPTPIFYEQATTRRRTSPHHDAR
jgi:1,4-dihydroxy-6-naphthoate synthase